MSGINNLFVTVHRKTEGALTIITFLASLAMLVIGVILFAEDTNTSYLGLQSYQAHFGLTVAEWEITYWAESLAPQVAQIVFFYVFFSNMKKNWWAALLALFFLALDFYADLYHRTQGTVTFSTLLDERTLAGAAITLMFFTIGAELFISMGWGLAMTTMAPAIKNMKRLIRDQAFALGSSQPRRSSNNSGSASINPTDYLPHNTSSRIMGE